MTMQRTTDSTHSLSFHRFLLGMGLTLALLALAFWLSLATATAAPQADTPTVALSTYYGGSLEECLFEACSVATDAQGNIYVAGTTRSDDFPLTNPYTTTFTPSGGEDLFLVKFAAGSHDVVYSTYLGRGQAQGLAVDSAGNAYVAGYTIEDEFPTTPNAAQPTYGGNIDAIVVKLSSDGSQLLYSSYLGGAERDEGFDVAVDDAGNIYLTGYTKSSNFPLANAYQSSYGGEEDVFVAKIAAGGSLEYSTYLGGPGDDQGWAIAVDSGGHAYLTGRSESDSFPTTAGVIQPDRNSGTVGSDAIVVKMTPTGGLAYGTFYNDDQSNNGVDIALDATGNAHIITTDMGAAKLNAGASEVLYQTDLLLDVGVDGRGGIAVDSDGVAFVTGWRGTSLDRDIVLTALTSSGRVAYSQNTGGSGDDRGHSVAIYEDAQGGKTAYITGKAVSSDFPLVDAVQTSLGGSQDAVVLSIEGLENLRLYSSFLPIVQRDVP
jgi:hypothetical protein